ncbi:M3 family oligoendopeptidase [Clostridium sp. 19966]|uniref:M3 family oligoendopeptidase n=1 Tax=Clostridium sp. 19966 TaxID=2768166 RepID=UPI0028DD5F4B|nr:M3 family oligoendopeptidase [Clostridium sp. 19966]MDT8718379.1 M3 family oligoendopeptidase [Clostridium sp. 19966]
MDNSLKMYWTLDDLYLSFQDAAFISDIDLLDKFIEDFKAWSDSNLKDFNNPSQKLEKYLELKISLEELLDKLSSFSSLRFSANAKDSEAKKFNGIIDKKVTALTEINVNFTKWLCEIDNLQGLIDNSKLLKAHDFYLNEIKAMGKYLLSDKEEALISKMRLTSSKAWANLKTQLASNLTVDIEIDGKSKAVGINTIKNAYFSNDKDFREKAFYAERESNNKIADGVAAALNGIKGEVLTLCEVKGYASPLNMTLENSRMDELTLNTMLKVMKESLPEFRRYLLKKAEILGYEGALPYYDIMAPIGVGNMNFSYSEAKDFIVTHFSSFSKDMGLLADTAFKDGWIDAEMREGKRSGAFCHGLHPIKQSRILCSFSGSFKNVCTLAHELGHAYHGRILENESILNCDYPMPLAETASLFAENIVRNAALKNADKDDALEILGTELVNCTSVVVDIYARFLFEKEFFSRRENGEVSLEEIKELMLWAQKEAYGDAVLEETLDPYAWIHKPHYYYAQRNFYNFPYAFGMLFAKGLYSIYSKEGSEFIPKYKEILKLTGQAAVYDVAKHAGIDLHDEAFWKASMNIVKENIDKFCNY